MTPTEVDRLFTRGLEDRDVQPCQLCAACLVWVPVKDKSQHFQEEHLR